MLQSPITRPVSKRDAVLCTIKEMAEELSIKSSTLYAWAAQGRIPCIKIHGLVRFRRDDIERWVESFRIQEPPIAVKRSQLVDAVASLTPCVIGMEACGSAHHWGRAFEQLGHTVKLMSPKYVRPYVKTNKNDGRDAEAICEAVSRPTMRFVSIKTVEQADMQALHRTRSLFVKHRTAVINQIRGLLAEYGLVIAQSPGEGTSRVSPVSG